MRKLVLVVAVLVACTEPTAPPDAPDGGPPPRPQGPLLPVQDGVYELEWDGSLDEAACPRLRLSSAGLELELLGEDEACGVVGGEYRESCRCYAALAGLREWCLCPAVGHLHADFVSREGVVVGQLDAYPVE